VYHDGLTVISGDSSGYLKTWDMRMGKVLQSILNEPTKKPISHLAISKQRGSLGGVSLAETEEPESRWLAVNSYDNGKSPFFDEPLLFYAFCRAG
jgi:COMPASS component SWD3